MPAPPRTTDQRRARSWGLTTLWGEALDPEAPLPEYPRPQLVRSAWQNLNGRWRYEVTPFHHPDPTAVADPLAAPEHWDGEIVVPFSPETALSGTGWVESGRTLRPDEALWYRRAFTLDPVPEDHRVLLQFGAVDQTCAVAVDGVGVGQHTGGYLPFTLDITAALRAGEEHELTVAVRDVTDTAYLSRGKQSSSRGGIWYTPQSGIWQTVWLEVVPGVAVDRLILTPAVDDGATALVVTVESDGAAPDARARVTVSAEGIVVAAADVAVGTPSRIEIPGARLWSPHDPFLHDVEVELGEDRVCSYAGVRTVGVGPDARGVPRLLLNGKPFLHVGLLDQGYWPDGGYTAPSDAALEYDVRLATSLGFTMLRKHIKIEPMRWYHHCDRLGILVWQDIVNGGGVYSPPVVTPRASSADLSDNQYRLFARGDESGRAAFRRELRATIENLRSVPSVVLWVPFNEGWGQFDAAQIAREVRDLDPTRPVDHASGWHDQKAGDVHSLHVYLRRFRVRRAWAGDDRALALSEFGGYSLAVPGHTWGPHAFGYQRCRSAADLADAFIRLHQREILPALARGLCATVYTQLSDVEDELNGVVTYDRRVVKIPVETVRMVNRRLVDAAPRI